MPVHSGWLNSACTLVEIGNDHWLYFASTPRSHAWNLGHDLKSNNELVQNETKEQKKMIYAAKWPKWRLFGFQAEPDGILTIEVKKKDKPSRLKLNYKSGPQGLIQAGILDSITQKYADNQNFDDCIKLTGDSASEIVNWNNGDIINSCGNNPVHLQLKIHDASVFAYEIEVVN
jgi:hypothetical protein